MFTSNNFACNHQRMNNVYGDPNTSIVHPFKWTKLRPNKRIPKQTPCSSRILALANFPFLPFPPYPDLKQIQTFNTLFPTYENLKLVLTFGSPHCWTDYWYTYSVIANPNSIYAHARAWGKWGRKEGKVVSSASSLNCISGWWAPGAWGNSYCKLLHGAWYLMAVFGKVEYSQILPMIPTVRSLHL